jgi:hypothetical protein
MQPEITDSLVKLARTLSSKEQSHFVKHLRQHKAKRESKLLKLFRLVVRQAKGELEDYKPASRSFIPANSLPPLRHLLYQKLLRFLALQFDISKRAEVSRMIDEAHLLINRGMIKEALKIARRAEQQAEQHQLQFLRLELSLLSRRLVRQFATQELQHTVAQDRQNAEGTLRTIEAEMEWHNRYEKLYLHKRLNQEEALQEALTSLPPRQQQPLPHSLEGQAYYHLGYRLKANAERDFEQELFHAQALVRLFEENDVMLTDQLPRYLRAVSNLITSYFRLGKMAAAYQKIKQMQQLKTNNYYQSAQLHSLAMSSEILYCFLTEQTQVVRRNAAGYEQLLEEYQPFIPHERYLEICYNTAVAFLTGKQYDGCLEWLNRCLIQRDNPAFQERRVGTKVGLNVETRAIALRLIVFYELGQERLLRRFIVRAKQYFKGAVPDGLQALAGIPPFLQLLQRKAEEGTVMADADALATALKQRPGFEEFVQWVEQFS